MRRRSLLALAAGALVIVGAQTSARLAGQPDAIALVRLPDGAIQPRAAVDSRGIVHVIYYKGEPSGGDLFYSRLRSDATFAPELRVNSHPGSAIAVGNIRGASLAPGRNGRVHVVWNGSAKAIPRAAGGATPMLYARLNDRGTAFESERNILQSAVGLDGGGTVAADAAGRVFVAWHAGGPASKGEGDRRVWLATSTDDGATFAAERAVSPAETGACGCCGMASLVDRRGQFYLTYRAARDVVHRDSYLLSSDDNGRTFSAASLEAWEIGACPMSAYALADAPTGVIAAWETAGQVSFTRITGGTSNRRSVAVPPGRPGERKHPAVAVNAKGEMLLAWTEGVRWQTGGAVAWQRFDSTGRPFGGIGRRDGVPVWSLVAAYARPDGGFVILY